MPIFEHRMIYHVGKSSLAITLPQNWLSYFGLTAGDMVEISGNGNLTIRPLKRQAPVNSGKAVTEAKSEFNSD